MAQPLHPLILSSFFFVILSGVAFTAKHNYPGLKSLHFTLYEQEIFNKTAYMIVRGVDTDVPLVGRGQVPFGSLYAFNDPLTISPDRSSKVVGSIEAMAVVSTLDGLQTVQAMKMSLNVKNHKGSISLVGAVPNIVAGDLVVVGGTGDFMFVQGYVTVTPYNITRPFLTYSNEYHLYWPPYATY